MILSAGKDFRRKANRRGTDIRSTSPGGHSSDFDWSLVVACREVLFGKQDLPNSQVLLGKQDLPNSQVLLGKQDLPKSATAPHSALPVSHARLAA